MSAKSIIAAIEKAATQATKDIQDRQIAEAARNVMMTRAGWDALGVMNDAQKIWNAMPDEVEWDMGEYRGG
jgi:hypothetical protein